MNFKRTLSVVAGVSLSAWLGGCASPMERSMEEQLRERLAATQRLYRDPAQSPVIEISREPSDVEVALNKSPGRIEQLDQESGPTAYVNVEPDLGTDLAGNVTAKKVQMTLQEVIQQSVRNNLDVQLARMQPAIDQATIEQAESVFDAVLFASFAHNLTDTPRPSSEIAGFGSTRAKQTQLVTGIRKATELGTVLRAQTQFTREFADPTLLDVSVFESASVEIGFQQPLLRGFGSDVNRAQIELTKSTRRQNVQVLRQQLLRTAVEAEQGYWNLVLARQQLLIQKKLLDRTEKERKIIVQREPLDTRPARITEANSFVELRRADVIRARQQVRVASDVLKRVINSPDLSVADETLIDPLDAPTEAQVSYSMLDAVTTALQVRPEVRQAMFQIDDTAIRQKVADNLRLPQLDLNFAIRYNGAGNNVGEAYDSVTEGNFIDYLIQLQFEVPIGNRGPEALLEQRRLEREAAIINYQRTAQQVVLEVKVAMRNLLTAYELIGATRAARRAAADNLRTLEVEERTGRELSADFLIDQLLQSQQRLANAEDQEMSALTGYNTAVAQLLQTMGTLLEHNGVEFDDPMYNAKNETKMVNGR